MEGDLTEYSRSISGTSPGALDPQQPHRVLRHPASRLVFAGFDPRTAFATPPDISKLSLKEEPSRPKRVVVEIAPNGACSWRFVPRAKRAAGVVDEGQWPRVVDICGENVLCTEEQWEIYKLDPHYECTVHATRTTVAPAAQTTPTDTLFGKRRGGTEEHARPAKRFRAGEPEASTMDDEEGNATQPHRARSRSVGRDARRLRPGLERLRRHRTQQAYAEAEAADQDPDDVMDDYAPPPEYQSKRKGRADEDSGDGEARDDRERHNGGEPTGERGTGRTYERTKASKRARTTSPMAARRTVEGRHLQRERRKRAKREEELRARAQQRHHDFMKSTFGAAMPDVRYANDYETANDSAATNGVQPEDDLPDLDEEEEDEVDELLSDDQEEEVDEETARRAAIEESRRKLAELERDRPLWEEQARMRAQSEQAEAARVRVSAADQQKERKRQEELRRKQEELKRQQEKRRKEEEEELRRQEEARRQQEAARQARRRRFAYGPWSAARALERYRMLSDEFDRTKWSAETAPLTFEDVPWPVLHSPASGFTVEDVDWSSVESFFAAVRPSMRAQDYRTFVQKSHLRFHPDRWRSRGVLKAVAEETERECLEVAANTVAQALTPIWSELKGR